MKANLFWSVWLACCSTVALSQTNAVTEYNVPTANSNPTGIAAGPDGALWFTLYSKNEIGRITTAGAFTEYPLNSSDLGYTPLINPQNIAAGPDGALWFTAGSYIGRMTTSGQFTLYPEGAGGAAGAITAGPDGALWFTDPETGSVGRITTAGSVTTYYVPTRDSSLADIVAGPDGALWITEWAANKIARMTTTGGVQEISLPNGGNPEKITVGPDGALWFTEITGDRIGRITTDGALSEFALPPQTGPMGIATGRDGALWVTETGNGRIGRLTTDGTFTEIVLPTVGGYPKGITSGADSAIWFTESGFYGEVSSGVSNIGTIQTIQPPTFTSLNPTSATACGPSFSLTLTGTNFQGNTVGGFGNLSALMQLSTTFLSSTQLQTTVTADLIQVSGTPSVVAATPDASGQYLFSNALPLPVAATPVIQQIGPSTIKAGSSTPMGLVISNYVPGVTSVRWGYTGGYLPVISFAPQGLNTAVTVSIPASLTAIPGRVQVSVVNVDGANQTGMGYPAACSPPQSVTIVAGLAITTASLPSGLAGSAYTPTTLQAQGGTVPYNWTANGLPANLTLSPAGTLSGTPAATGDYTVSVTVTDSSYPQQTASQTYNLIVNGALSIITSALPNGSVNVAYPTTTFTGQGGSLPYRWTANGLPSNLSLSADGILSGIPTAAGSYSVTVTLADNSSRPLLVSQTYTLVINAALSITTTSLPSGTAGVAYPSTTLHAQGGTAPYSWVAGGLPPKLTFSLAGVLEGVPNAAGTYTVTVTAKDGAGQTSSKTYSLAISLPDLPPVRLSVNSQPASISDQPSLSANLDGSYPYPLTGTLTLSFEPDAAGLPPGYLDTGLQFNNGKMQMSVSVPSGSGSLPAIQVGSVAGTITVTLSTLTAKVNGQSQNIPLPSPPHTTIAVPRLSPVIVPGSVKITNVTSSGFMVELQASSTPRDLAKATLVFTGALGTQLTGTTFDIPLGSAASDWFSSPQGRSAGGTFDLQIPFTYSGDTSAVGSVSVTLTNSVQESAAVAGGR